MPHRSRVLKTRFLKSTAESLTIWWRRTNDLTTKNSNEEQLWVGDWTIWTTKRGAIWRWRTATKNRSEWAIERSARRTQKIVRKKWKKEERRKPSRKKDPQQRRRPTVQFTISMGAVHDLQTTVQFTISSSSFLFLHHGSLRVVARSGTWVLETRVPRGIFIHVTKLEVWNLSFKNSRC